MTFIIIKCIIIVANYERLSGVDMKKTVCLMLILSLALTFVLAFSSCDNDEVGTLERFTEIVKSSDATRVVTIVEVVDKDGEELGGRYAIDIDGNNSISEYAFRTYRTIEDGVGDFVDGGQPDRFKNIEGKAYYKDGKLSYDGDKWSSGDPVAVNLKLNLDLNLLLNPVCSEDGTTLTAKVSADKAKEVLGVEINAEGDISLTVVATASRLTSVSVSCITKNGSTMDIKTSYSYVPATLVFPGAEEAPEAES